MAIDKTNLANDTNNKEKNECDNCTHACTVYSYECTVCPYNYEYNGIKK